MGAIGMSVPTATFQRLLLPVTPHRSDRTLFVGLPKRRGHIRRSIGSSKVCSIHR